MGYAFTANGELLAEASGLDWVTVWDTHTGKSVASFKTLKWVACVSFSPDGRLLAAGCGYDGSNRSFSRRAGRLGSFYVWDMATHRPVVALPDFPLNIWSVAFSPDGKFLAAAMGEYRDYAGILGVVRIWDTANWSIVQDLRGHETCVWCVAFDAQGKRLASASGPYTTGQKGEVILWDVGTWHELWRFRNPAGAIYGVAFSQDGRRLAMGGVRGVQLLDGTPLAETPAYAPLPFDP